MSRPDLKELYLRALELEGDERERWLESRCADDPNLYIEVRAMLGSTIGDRRFLSSPTASLRPARRPGSYERGDSVGPYKILEMIGEGSFGAVYLAEQRSPVVRRVALKILRGDVPGHEVEARFEAERQALAMMSHPNIVKILDAGTDPAGRPYFVMDLVVGHHITRHCDELRRTVRARLEMLVQVCEAVAHAHSKGVIHRDIKPGNVLVSTRDGRAHAMVIDFGVAKAMHARLTDKTLATAFHGFIGTPEYMSPEQASGAVDIDTRADVYSLGVLMYELITGVRPFEELDEPNLSLVRVLQVIRDVQPSRPSARLSRLMSGAGSRASRANAAARAADPAAIASARGTEPRHLIGALRGELDWIVMTAIEKDPDRRYQTAHELALDLRRYLDGHPVSAAPPSLRYKILKSYRRHRWASVSAAAAFATLLVFLAVVSALYVRSERARESAQRLATEVERKNAEMALAKDGALEQKERAELERVRADIAAREADRRRVELEKELYFSEMRQAGFAWRERAMERLAGSLEVASPEQRGWEWRLLASHIDGSVISRSSHEEAVTAVAVSPGGELIATASDDYTVSVMNAATGDSYHLLRGHRDAVIGADFTGERSMLVTWSRDGTARLWDAGRGTLERVIHTAEGYTITAGDVSRSARTLALAGADGKIRLIPLAGQEPPEVLDAHLGMVHSVSFSPDGASLLSTGVDATAQIWDLRSRARSLLFTRHDAGVIFGSYTGRGDEVMTSSADHTTYLWDSRSGSMIENLTQTLPHVIAAGFDPGSQRAVFAWNEQVVLFDTRVWRRIGTYFGFRSPVRSVALADGGSRIIAGDARGEIRVWQSGGAQEWFRFNSLRAMRSGVSADETRIVLWQSGSVQMRDLDTGSLLGIFRTPGIDPAQAWLTPDGDQIVVLDRTRGVERFLSGRGVILDPWTGEVRTELLGVDGMSEHFSSAAGYHNAVFSPTGRLVLAPTRTGSSVVAVDWSTGERRYTIQGHRGAINAISFSPDGALVATASVDSSVRLWSAEDGAAAGVIEGHDASPVMGVEFSPAGGAIVTTTLDRVIRVWRTADTNLIGVVRLPEPASGVLAVSEDGGLIVVLTDDHRAQVWNTRTGLMGFEFQTHGAYAMDFLPDASRLIWSDAEGRTVIFDARSDRKREILELARHTPGATGAFYIGSDRFVVSGPEATFVLDARPAQVRTSRLNEIEQTRAAMSARLRSWLNADGPAVEHRRRLAGDRTLDEQQRRAALGIIAESQLEEFQKIEESRRHVYDENAAPEQRLRTLENARVQAARYPDSSAHAFERAVAAYNAGEYEEAIESVMRSNTLALVENGWDRDEAERAEMAHPSYLTYFALANLRLGRADEARSLAKNLRNMIDSEHFQCDCYRYAQRLDAELHADDNKEVPRGGADTPSAPSDDARRGGG